MLPPLALASSSRFSSARSPTCLRGLPYPVFAISGLVPWRLHLPAVGTVASLVRDANLMSKVYFPASPSDLEGVRADARPWISTIVLLAVMAAYGVGFSTSPSCAGFPPACGMAGFGAARCSPHSTSAIATWAGVPVLMQIWFFPTPVIYPGSLSAGRAVRVRAQPDGHGLDGIRWSLLGARPQLGPVAVSVVSALLVSWSAIDLLPPHRAFLRDII